MPGSSGADPAGGAPDRRKLIAVVHADMAGYSRLIGLDDVGTLQRLRALRRGLIDPAIDEHGGRIVQTGGDSLLIVFDSIDGAVRCAVEVQQQVPVLDADLPPDRAIRFRVGINIGDAIADGTDLHGDAVNVAVRLQAECPTGGICVSRSVRDHVRGRLDLTCEELGALDLKNIMFPVEAFVLKFGEAAETLRSVDRSVGHAPGTLPLPDKPSIAVLPFQNLSGDLNQEHFAYGLVEDLITNLSRLRWLFVIARNSSFTYKGVAIDIRQVGRELGVRYVLEGSVRRIGDQVRVTAQLIEAENGRHIWAERYDRRVEDIFGVQDEITETISTTLEPEISAAERKRARTRQPGNLGAWELYQRGMWHLLRRNHADFEVARALFQDATKLDPDFATPHAALAISSFWLITHDFTTRPEETLAELAREASLAVDLDALDPLAHSAMGLAEMSMGHHDRAITEHEVATGLSPNSAFAQWSMGYALVRADRFDEALAKFELALRLNPRDGLWEYITLKAAALYQLRRYEESAAVAQEAARVQLADVVWPLVHCATSLAQIGKLDDAAHAIAELRARRPGLTIEAFRAWLHNRPRSAASLDHMVAGLRKAGLPEA